MPEKDRDEPVSLAPLDPEEALRALLAVKPEDDQSSDDAAKSGGSSDDG